jgi:hypothetical protein
MKALIIFLVLVGFVICDGAEMARRPHLTNSAGLRNPTHADLRTTVQQKAVQLVDPLVQTIVTRWIKESNT